MNERRGESIAAPPAARHGDASSSGTRRRDQHTDFQ